MNDVTERLGIMPALILGGMLAIAGGWLLVTIMNNTWLVPIDHIRFQEFRRSVVLDTVDPTALMQAADWRLIAFFLLAVLLLTMGLALPIAYALNSRWQLERQPVPSIFLVGRQSLWLGFIVAICTWLQMIRSLWWPVAILVAVFFFLVEGLLVLRVRSAEYSVSAETPYPES